MKFLKCCLKIIKFEDLLSKNYLIKASYSPIKKDKKNNPIVQHLGNKFKSISLSHMSNKYSFKATGCLA